MLIKERIAREVLRKLEELSVPMTQIFPENDRDTDAVLDAFDLVVDEVRHHARVEEG